MSKSSTLVNRVNAREILSDQWTSFLAGFTKENRGAHARLEVVSPDAETGYRVQTENRPLDGVSADISDRESTVWITFATAPGDGLSHGVPHATVIRYLPATKASGPVLEVETADGTRTILELAQPEAYALPPSSAIR
jgi:hypothetical protein